ncbi:hypothetical protein PoB_001703700 [Plakobranchus ocellatus]|uniref:Uncharacterized protein n=1 Tax=Plakobranchus ocellatus TaxID=259542 RepID=A0AAV3Z7N4_9GAST|nr:hypothetical protein PoB_001703700 [Plakobranchus ocellatus]
MRVVFLSGDLSAAVAGVFGMWVGSDSTTVSLIKLSKGGWELLSGGVLDCSCSGVLTGAGHVAGADVFDVVKTPGVVCVPMAVREDNVATGDLAITG